MIALVASVLAASFVGSVHCAAMCGGFVAFASRAQDGVRTGAGPLAWQAGRLIAYLALGAAAGSLGARLDQAGAWVGVHRAAACVAGGLMIAWGAWTLSAPWRGSGRAPQPGLPLHRAMGRVLRAIGAWPPEARSFTLGLATALLPCGFLWAFVTTAAASGHASHGALVMLACWAGTLPALVGSALVARRALDPLQRRLPQLTAIAMVVLGLLTVAGRIGPHAHAAHASTEVSSHDCH